MQVTKHETAAVDCPQCPGEASREGSQLQRRELPAGCHVGQRLAGWPLGCHPGPLGAHPMTNHP
jgi:hypothetical protein